MPPKSTTTRSPASARRDVGRACGRALFGPDATIVSKAGFSNPARFTRQSMSAAISSSVRPARTTVSSTSTATADNSRPASRSVSISLASFTSRGRSTASVTPTSVTRSACAAAEQLAQLPGPLDADVRVLETDAARQPSRGDQIGQPSIVTGAALERHRHQRRRRDAVPDQPCDRGTVAEVCQQVKATGRHDQHAGGSREPRQVPDVGRVDDDERVDALGGEGLDDAGVTPRTTDGSRRHRGTAAGRLSTGGPSWPGGSRPVRRRASTVGGANSTVGCPRRPPPAAARSPGRSAPAPRWPRPAPSTTSADDRRRRRATSARTGSSTGGCDAATSSSSSRTISASSPSPGARPDASCNCSSAWARSAWRQ